MIKTVLFDLDGTLLPMDNDVFTKGYFKLLVKKLAPHGYSPQELIDGIWAGTAAMVKNDGSCTNEQAFWKKFSSVFGNKCLEDKPIFDEFYKVDFQLARGFCGFNPKAREAVKTAKACGCAFLLPQILFSPQPQLKAASRGRGWTFLILSFIQPTKTVISASPIRNITEKYLKSFSVTQKSA